MGIEKYFAGIVMIILTLTAFSSFYQDSIVASGQTSSPYASALNDTNVYYSGLANQTDATKNGLMVGSVQSSVSFDVLSMLGLASQTVATSVIMLLASLGIFFSISGLMSSILPIMGIFMGLGILWVVLTLVFSMFKAIRLGDTSG